jgi:hypothetical protein
LRSFESSHNRQAPYRATGLFICCATGLATIRDDDGPFWKGSVLDMVSPARNDTLIRGRFTSWADNAWARFFTPTRTVIIFLLGWSASQIAHQIGCLPQLIDNRHLTLIHHQGLMNQ